jgi:hypothetical protein
MFLWYGIIIGGILNTKDPVHMLTLHLVYIPRINRALSELMEAFNHHAVRTERNWTPYQMWVNGMMHVDNPLSQGELDENPDDIELYGYDPDGPSTQEDQITLSLLSHRCECRQAYNRGFCSGED